MRKETQRIPGTKDLLTCCRADGVHPLNETKSTTVATKAVSQVAADDESTQILKALNGLRLHRERTERAGATNVVVNQVPLLVAWDCLRWSHEYAPE